METGNRLREHEQRAEPQLLSTDSDNYSSCFTNKTKSHDIVGLTHVITAMNPKMKNGSQQEGNPGARNIVH
jgi:hypothetical protein